MTNNNGRAQFVAAMNVSRETMARLDRYEVLIKKWNPSINLVAKSTLEHLWARHFLVHHRYNFGAGRSRWVRHV